ncbi:MAG: hypothetical protein IJV24_07060 [Prevotella sp.]|nr:hypothetical protein [Prevotella sp.]
MKIEQLHDLLSDRIFEFERDAEILVEGEDGLLYDFTLADTEEQFDGFDTFYPAGLKIVLKRQ